MDSIRFRTRAGRARAGQSPSRRPVNPAYVDRYDEDDDYEDVSDSEYVSDGEEYFDAPEAAGVAHRIDSTAVSEPPGRPAVQGISPQASHNLAAPAVVRDVQTYRGRFFARCTFSRGPPPFIDLTRLEFYQIFPHDAAATLCKMHFLSLARAWIRRREGCTEADLQRLAKAFPHAHSDHQLDRARNLTTLGQAIARDKWRQTPIPTFVQDVARKIEKAEQLLRGERHKIIAETGQPPLCGLGGGGKQILVCGYCAAMKRPTENLYQVLQQAREKIPHGNFHRADMPAVDEFKAKPRPAKETKLPSPMALSLEHAYISVGELHFVVDVCNSRTHIKMQNTNMALPMSQGFWKFGAGLLQKHLCELPNAFDLASCRLDKDNCLCCKPDFQLRGAWAGA